tara:strand:+ start:1077 stop:1760 length:684 start_codon:yes stop_codon:yes gene_type:complete
MKRIILTAAILFASQALTALEKHDKAPIQGHETFADYKPEIFTQFPTKNSEVRDGVLWTRGESGGKYPPTVGFPIAETDCALTFHYRHLGDGNMIWLFINGDDGFGGFDHILRVKLTRNSVGLQVDSHTKDPNHPDLQADRNPDATSGAYRVSEKLIPDPIEDLDDDEWHELKMVFEGNTVKITLDGRHWKTELTRPGFAFEKQEIALFLAGGEKGIEIDDLKVTSN